LFGFIIKITDGGAASCPCSIGAMPISVAEMINPLTVYFIPSFRKCNEFRVREGAIHVTNEREGTGDVRL